MKATAILAAVLATVGTAQGQVPRAVNVNDKGECIDVWQTFSDNPKRSLEMLKGKVVEVRAVTVNFISRDLNNPAPHDESFWCPRNDEWKDRAKGTSVMFDSRYLARFPFTVRPGDKVTVLGIVKDWKIETEALILDRCMIVELQQPSEYKVKWKAR